VGHHGGYGGVDAPRRVLLGFGQPGASGVFSDHAVCYVLGEPPVAVAGQRSPYAAPRCARWDRCCLPDRACGVEQPVVVLVMLAPFAPCVVAVMPEVFSTLLGSGAVPDRIYRPVSVSGA